MSLFKRKKNNEQALELPKTIEDKATQSLRYMLPSLLIALAGLLVASAVIWFSQSAHNAEQAQEQVESWGAAYTAAINQRLAFIQADTQSAASNPYLALVLKSNDPELKRSTERTLLHRASAIDAFISPAGQTAQDHNRNAPINFAALDLLQRAESGAQPQPEALQVGQRWLLYSATKLSGAKSAGSLLIAYDAASVFKGLPVFANNQLQITLQQQFQNAPLQTLYSQGNMPNNGTSYSFSTQHPNWTLVLTTPSSFAQQSSLLSALLIAIGLAALFIVCALYFIHITIQRQLRADAQTLSLTIQDWAHGKSIKPLSLNMIELQSFAQNLTHNVQATPSKQAKKTAPIDNDDLTAGTDATALANNTKNNIFNSSPTLDTDILDIDILEEDLDVFGLDQASNSLQRTTAASDVPSSIFRAYDIRGIVGQTLTTDTAYWIGRAVGSESIANGEPSVVVGRDGRLSGPDMAQALIQGLLDCGCSVTDLGMVPTPVLYFATHVLEARSGVMVTGSHNPPDYNGFKIVIAGETLANERITALHTRIVNDDLSHGVGMLENVEMLDTYLEHIRNDIALAKPLRVVVDCGNGVGGVIGPRLLEALGCTVIPLYCEVDGTFPNHHPDPGKPENLVDLIARVKSEQADIGIAFDGDADRLGVVTNSGDIIYPDRLMMLFAKDVVSRNPGADVIFDVKCTRRLSALISGYGGRPIMWKTGHSLIKAKMKETGALLAGEMSGHIFFKERWFGFDDGIYSAARLLEIISLDSRNVDQVFSAFPVSHSTPEITVEVTDENKFAIIERLQREAKWGDASITTLDGVRADYPKGWGLVRASNTTPMLVLRFEGDSPEDLAQIQALFREQILALEPDINLPF
ncbi:MAG: phosphomannomutase/phosphoglucomutase [Thiopseudomonas sp.]|nr:phosphomannomutase/phosphoglucomutase [Thiopseudomonas sp.]MBP7996554.1 phosphomannomutase/phosphoglucomutase [Thiopseudomonas sp.]